MKKEMFLFIVAFILRIYSVRTDDDYDIDTTEMDTIDYAVPTATTFMEDYEEIVYYTVLDEEQIRVQPNFDSDVYKLDVWKRKPYQWPYTPLKGWNRDFENWKPRKINLKPIKIPTYTNGGGWSGRKIYKPFSVIVGVVLFFYGAIKCIINRKSKKSQRDVSEHIIPSVSGSSQSGTIPSNNSPTPNRSVLLNFPDELDSSNSAPRSQQTEPAVQKRDSKGIVILIPLNSQKDETEHPETSYAKDLRLDTCHGGLDAHPGPPPPYQ